MTGETPPMTMPTMPTMPPTFAEQIASLVADALLADIPDSEVRDGLRAAQSRLERAQQRALMRLLDA